MNYISGLPNEVTHQTFREKTRPGIYYHYTSLSTLWAVLDNECLRATQACFSNDSEEVAKGKRVIAEIYNDKDNPARPAIDNNNKMLFGETEENIDCYIICFCGEDDKLSQWRAYCRNDGVSIGFAFDGTEPLYYFADQPYNIQTGHAAELYPVWYLDENNALHSSAGEHIKTTAALQADIKEQLDKIEELSDEHHKKDFLLSAIPLIKHAGFYEEDEHRLLIRNTQLEHGGRFEFPLDDYIQYRLDEGIQHPYLNIRFGKSYPDDVKSPKDNPKLHSAVSPEEVEIIELYGIDEDIFSKIQTAIAPIKVVSHPNTDHPQIVIGPAPEQAQKKVFNIIDDIVNDDNKNAMNKTIKIWCQGHLPIRSICVSPCGNQDQVVKSIKHYCLHKKYWLKYVDVFGSSTPYRRPR